MRTVFEKMSRYALLRAIIYLVLGLLIVLAPNTVTHIIVYLVAAVLAVLGIISIVGYLRDRGSGSKTQLEFIGGVLLIVLAIIVVVFAKPIISILPIFYGVLIVLSGASFVVQAVGMGKSSKKSNAVLWVFAIIFILAGLLIIFNPFRSLLLLLQIFGVVLMVLGISEIIAFIYYRGERKK